LSSAAAGGGDERAFEFGWLSLEAIPRVLVDAACDTAVASRVVVAVSAGAADVVVPRGVDRLAVGADAAAVGTDAVELQVQAEGAFPERAAIRFSMSE
jgi:hypothetical protein